MKKIIFLILMAAAITTTAYGDPQPLPMEIHQTGAQSGNLERDRSPIRLPLSVYYDSDTNIIEVWCQDDNIQAEVFVNDENGNIEAYSPYMNVAILLTSIRSHSILLAGDGWEAEAHF